MTRTPPIISWVNVLRDATLTVSDETADGVGLNAVDGLTYDYWVPSTAANIEFQLPAPIEVGCFGVAAHTLASQGASIWLEYWDGAAWVEISRPYVSYVDVTIFDYFDASVTADLFRVNVSGPVAIGVLWVGPALQMQRNIYQGHTPVTLAERNSQRANQTETGEWRGVVQTIQGAELNAAFSNLSAAWVRSELAGFITHVNDGGTFFWAWYVDKYPREVAYCWNSGGDLQANNSGPRDLMSLTIQASAYLDGPNPIVNVITSTPYAAFELQQAQSNFDFIDADVPPIYDLNESVGSSGLSFVSGELRDLIVEYEIGDGGFPGEQVNAGVMQFLAGDLRGAVQNYDAGNEFVDSTGLTFVAGTLESIVVEYEIDAETVDSAGLTFVSGSLT